MNKLTLQTNPDNNDVTIARIKSGAFRHCYLIYNRKSTDEPENQKNSIVYQKSENTRFAYREHLPIASVSLKGFCVDGIISEKHSGFKENSELLFGEEGTITYHIDRPKFYQLVQYVSEGYFKGVIFLCWDRASRNKGDSTVISKLMKQGVDFRFTLAMYDKTSSGELHKDIDGMFAEHHSRVTSEKVTLNIRNKREQGYCTYKAPVGYLNTGTMENKPVDPTRAPIITRLFELYATGDWSLADLARYATEQGFTMQHRRRRRNEEEKLLDDEEDEAKEIEAVARPPTFNRIHGILNNRFYVGEIKGNDGLYVKSNSHEGIVSQELFHRVQQLLNKRKVSAHYLNRLHYPLRGIIRCSGCQRIYTPYTQKGITYYRCRCAKECENTYRNSKLDILFQIIGVMIGNLALTDMELDVIQTKGKVDMAELASKQQAEKEENSRKLKRLQEDLSYLRSNKLILLKTGAYSPEGIAAEEERLSSSMIFMQQESRQSDAAISESINNVVKLSELLKTVYLHYEKAKSGEKEQLIKYIFSELYLFGTELKYKCKNGFQALESRFILNGAQKSWLSELQKYHTPIKKSIAELETIHNASP